MKKLLALMLALVMVFAMVACTDSNDDDDKVRGEKTELKKPGFLQEDDEEEETESSGDVVATEPVATEPVATAPEEIEPEEPEEEGFLGENDGIQYESKFIGIGCTLPEGWSFYTDEELRQLNNVAEGLYGEELVAALEQATIVYDMGACSPDGVSNCMINLEKADNWILAVTDVKTVYENQAANIKAIYENAGATDVAYEMNTVTIGGQTLDGMCVVADLYGTTIMQQVFCIKCDGYLASIVVTATSEADMQAVLDCFYLV